MKIDVANVRKCLKDFDFSTLFREHLGWDKHQAQLDIPIDGGTVQLTAVAQKRGFIAYVCPTIPDRDVRRKIDHQVTKSAREHFIIYADEGAGQQVWQWVRRDPGKPIASRDHRFDVKTTGDALIQRLDQIAVALDEEESITVVDVASRARAAFDVDKVTKRFYDRFKVEHAAFLKFIKGIKGQADLEWYTSLMLNRLMFVYFIQKKGFLDGDTNYLQNRLRKVRELKGKDKFHSFYRYFLIRLFHDGLGKHETERKLDRDLEKLIGKVPYLNGGFFEVHQLEERNTDIDIPDKAFEKLFAFFDEFSWHLDERPLRAGNEINPDVVGYIFEKYINQKQMGAYYTKEDITEYISKNTIIPFLFDAAQKKCPIAFKPDSFLWRLLSDDPDRYIYAAVRHGVIHSDGTILPETELPDFVQQGLHDVSARMHNKRFNLEQAPKDDPIRLPTETWREYMVRRQRCLEIRGKLQRGEVHQINDLITLNLDIWQFARDAIVNSEGPELLRAFWHAIAGRIPEKSNEKLEPGLTVLDPTCGSGAFLFAALRILETLYSDCLQGMARFIDEPNVPLSPEEQLADLIARGENERTEFKATMRHCIKTAQSAIPEDKRKEVLKGKDKERNHDVLKSVAAMLNTAGGNVLVGVQDDGTICGLDLDYAYFKESDRNPDGYEHWLRQLFVHHFGVLNSQKIRALFVKLEGKEVLWLQILPAETAAYVHSDNNPKTFYVRNGNETRALDIEQIVAYHQTRFTPEAIKSLPGPSPEPIAKPGKKKRFEDFRSVLAQIAQHPNERYFILKSIIIHNLYGVDIMEEAVEICKLRLFLKLVAQVEYVDQIEPLPDIDFNIRAGNTLVGYVSVDEIRKARVSEQRGDSRQILILDSDAEAEIRRIEEDALQVEKCFEQFRAQQTKHGGKVTAKDKRELRHRLARLDQQLDRYLAGEYGINVEKEKAFDAWKTSHQPFHWFVEFYGIMRNGGFDVIIGNPPYISSSKVRKSYCVKGYYTDCCTDIYAWCLERVSKLTHDSAFTGMIVPLSLAFSGDFFALRSLLYSAYRTNWFSSFGRIPSALFAHDVRVRNTIHLGSKRGEGCQYTTRLHRWFDIERPHLFSALSYAPFEPSKWAGRVPKLNTAALIRAFETAASNGKKLEDVLAKRSTKYTLHFKKTAYNWLNFCRKLPPCYDENGNSIPHSKFGEVFFSDSASRNAASLILNGKLQLAFWVGIGDDFDVTRWMFGDLPVDLTALSETELNRLASLADELDAAMKEAVSFKLNAGKKVGNYNLARCRHITDKSDRILARAFGFDAVWEDIELLYTQIVRTDFSESSDENDEE